jgi:hypothetical protein
MNSCSFRFYFRPQISDQDSCRNSAFLRQVRISSNVPGFNSDGLPISTICPPDRWSHKWVC